MQFLYNSREFRDIQLANNYDLFKLNESLIDETIIYLIGSLNIENESKFGQESNELFDYGEPELNIPTPLTMKNWLQYAIEQRSIQLHQRSGTRTRNNATNLWKLVSNQSMYL